MGGRNSKENGKKGEKSLGLDDVRLMRELFEQAGVKGQMDLEQMKELLKLLGLTVVPGELLFEMFDENKDGSVAVKEFIMCMSVLLYGTPDSLSQFLFRFYDKNGDGEIDKSELVNTFQLLEHLGLSMGSVAEQYTTPNELADEALRRHDSDKSGTICFEEFKDFLKQNNRLSWIKSLQANTNKAFNSMREQNESRLVMLELERLIDDEVEDISHHGRSELSMSIVGEELPKYKEIVKAKQTSLGEMITRNALRKQNSVSSIARFRIPYNAIIFHEELGSGSHAVVYRGEWLNLPVAVKVVKEELRATLLAQEEDANEEQVQGLWTTFESELKVLGDLRHPNIMLYMGAVLEPDRPLCIVSEFMSGGSLYKYLNDGKSFLRSSPLSYRLKIALEICRGVLYLHSRDPPVLHRDLKSENVLIDGATGRAVVADFGISIRTSDQNEASIELGTAATMAPEVIDGDLYEEASDVYSVAIILWEVMTLRIPYQGMPAPSIMFNVSMNDLRPEFLPEDDLSAEWQELIQSMWKQEPKDRPTMQEVVQDISSLLKATA